MAFFHVRLSEKTIYAKIINARAAVFDLRGIKGQGHFFFCWKWLFFRVNLPEKTIYAKIINAQAAVFYLLWVKGWGNFFNLILAGNGLF